MPLFNSRFRLPEGFSGKRHKNQTKPGLPTSTLLNDGVNGKVCPSVHLRFLDGSMAGLGGLPGALPPGCSRIQLPDPANRNPVSVLAQLV